METFLADVEVERSTECPIHTTAQPALELSGIGEQRSIVNGAFFGMTSSSTRAWIRLPSFSHHFLSGLCVK